MKTPDEIKKGLECCMDYQSCAEYGEPKCPYNDVTKCMEALLSDALAYIQKLESRLAQVERVRDAAVRDILHVLHTKGTIDAECLICNMEKPDCHWECEKAEWRGVCEENTKEDGSDERKPD